MDNENDKPVPRSSVRGISTKARAYQARMRSLRRNRRAAVERSGGDWRATHWANGNVPGLYADGAGIDGELPVDGNGVHALDFNDRSVVDWSDMDKAEDYN